MKNFLQAHSLNLFVPGLFTLSIGSFIWRYGDVVVGSLPKPFEIIISLVLLLVFFEILFQKERFREFMSYTKPLIYLLAGILGLSLIGLIISFNFFPSVSSFSAEVIFEYVRILFAFMLFFLTSYIVYVYGEKINWFLKAIFFSPLLLFLAFIPSFQDFFMEDGRLVGAQNDPNYLATFLALGLIVGAVYFLYTEGSKRWWGVCGVVLISPLFLWAYSRAAYLSLGVILLFFGIFYLYRHFSWSRTAFLGILISVFIFSTAFSFFVLPQTSQAFIYRRSIAPAIPHEGLRLFMADYISRGDEGVFDAVLRKTEVDTFSTSRGRLWRDGSLQMFSTPLGFGPAYHNWNPIDNFGRPHNTYLEVALTTGWVGLILFLYFLRRTLRGKSHYFYREDFIGGTLLLGIIYLLVNGLFLDMFTYRPVWLILGMIVGYSYIQTNERS